MPDPDQSQNPNCSKSGNPADSRQPDPFKAALPYVLPLFAHLLLATLFSSDVAGSYEGDGFEGSEIPTMTRETWQYIGQLGLQAAVAIGFLVYFRKTYFRQFPFRISPVSFLVGAIGVVLWVAVCYPEIEGKLLVMLGFDLSRPGFNPFLIGDDSVRLLFLFVRFSILCLIVPVIEELFVRGWLIRWYDDPDFESVTLSNLSTKALIAASVYGVVAHPMEAVAAFLWFGLVTLMMRRTGNFWDCVVAHAVTNLLLGLYVLKFSAWQLW